MGVVYRRSQFGNGKRQNSDDNTDARWYEHRDTGECNITTLHFRTGKDAVEQIVSESRGGLRNQKKPVY